MKRNLFLIIVVLVTVLLVGADLATALEPVPTESGFSGFFRPGVGYLRYKTNMVASFLGYDLAEKKTDYLTDSPDAESTGFALFPFALRYTFASTATQVFLGSDIYDLARFDYAQQIGVKQGLGRFGILQGGFLFSSIPAKVWKDPYIADQDRKKTNRKSMGFRLVWDRIMDTHLELQYTYRKIDISSEQSGNFLGLSSDARDRLKRDGDNHSVQILYRFTLADKHRLVPAFIYTKDDRDGEAMKSDVYDFQLTYAYLGDPFTLFLNGLIGWADYDKKNPIYGKKQEDDRYGFNGQLYYKNPWGWTLLGSQPMVFYVSTAYVEYSSNIDFYDQEGFMATVGVGWTW